MKLYWSPVSSPAQGPATDRMLGHESGTDKRRKLELGMQSLIYLGPGRLEIHKKHPQFHIILQASKRSLIGFNPNSEGVPATHLSEGGGHIVPPLVNTVLMAQTS